MRTCLQRLFLKVSLQLDLLVVVPMAENEQECWASIEGYTHAHHPRYTEAFKVPLVIATEKTLESFGRVVTDFDAEDVWIEAWPTTTRRSVIPGTGRGAGISQDRFRVFWENDLARAEEVPPDPDEYLVTGRLPSSVNPSKRTSVLVRDFTAHPDGGQVFYPTKSSPFIQVLGPAKVDVQPSDMVAFYFDGDFGVQIRSNVWHNFPYPVQGEITFNNKQSAVLACVMVDFVKEFNRYLEIPLNTHSYEIR